MKKTLRLAENDRAHGSYLRKDYKSDVLNGFFHYQEINIAFPKAGSSPRVKDDRVSRMVPEGLISEEQKEAYEHQVRQRFAEIDRFDDYSMEDIYRCIHKIRRKTLGADAVEKDRWDCMCRGVAFDPAGGIDQRKKKQALLQRCKAAIFVLFQPEFFVLMRADMDEAVRLGKEIYVLASGDRGDILTTKDVIRQGLETFQHSEADKSNDVRFLEADADYIGGILEGIEWEPQLQEWIDGRESCLLAYGEEGLLHCRGLRVEAVVSAIPEGYHARAVVNQLNCRRACVAYIPAGFDITRWVRLTERTRLSYWQLAKLWEAYGDRIYEFSPEELYRRYPQYFINIYNNLSECVEAKPEYPVKVCMSEVVSEYFGGEDALEEMFAGEGEFDLCKTSVMGRFDHLREQAINRYLNQFSNLQYEKVFFDGPILVNAVRVKKAEGARVIRCEKGAPLREMFSREGLTGPAIVSNFLFFLTPKLAALYNDLRKDRPREQVDVQVGHLDYMLYEKDGKRIETFPLFRKTCIAMKENGEFLFFNFRLGGGKVRVGDFSLSWKSADVDVLQGLDSPNDFGTGMDIHPEDQSPVRIYTPYYSLPDRDADRQTYRKPVGEGRVNLVILQDKVCCVRKGDVILPGFGVVVSLEETLGQMLLSRLGLQPLGDGYYDADGLELTVELDAPGQIPPEQWEQVKWAYGGGLSLILDGKGLCDGDMEQWFEEEGWMTPLSRQTQESALHKLEKHPRTAIGTTENGDLVILVYSGRTKHSVGADYREMCEMARVLFPDIKCLMNVDGGGSAMLGMVVNGSFMELSCPSTSTDSCVGMTRPVNTVLYIPAGE